jgi:hypothetical protein
MMAGFIQCSKKKGRSSFLKKRSKKLLPVDLRSPIQIAPRLPSARFPAPEERVA